MNDTLRRGLVAMGDVFLRACSDELKWFEPMLLWTSVSAVFGLFQIWTGTLKCRHRAPDIGWDQCVKASMADGNLLIFAIGTAGGVLAVTLSELFRRSGGLYEHYQASILMIPVAFIIIVFAANAWTEGKVANGSKPKGSGSWSETSGLSAELDDRSITESIYAGSCALIFAIITEALR
jgi:hypothetical protein